MRRTIGDFNGDGVIDIFGFDYSDLAVLLGKPNYPVRITKIEDGMGLTTRINYKHRRNDLSGLLIGSNILPLGPSILTDFV